YIYTNFFLLLFYLVCSTTSFDRVHFYLVVFFSISFPSQISRLHCTGNWEIKVNQQENIIPYIYISDETVRVFSRFSSPLFDSLLSAKHFDTKNMYLKHKYP
ncbi:GSCOCG00000412001-RA-CDS, partial [Cotesia congregata]